MIVQEGGMTMERSASISRRTKETDISLTFNLDGSGKSQIETGIGFFDHMLEGFARHGFFDLAVTVNGDLHVDCHHSVEDAGIVLGTAIRQAEIKQGSGVMVPVSFRWTMHLRYVRWICAEDRILRLTVSFRHPKLGILTQNWYGNFFMPYHTAPG